MISIISNRKKCFLISLIVILAGVAAMIFNGVSGKGALNLDIDFTGGTAMVFDIGKEFNNDDIAKIVTDITGQSSPQIQKIIGTNEVSIKMQSVDGETRTKILEGIKEKYGISDEGLLSSSDISATVSGEMQKSASIAVSVACILMLLYITIRFHDYRTGLSAIFALVHDVLVMLAFYALFRIPVNNSFIAAMLTILGYSINATIVIFDRIRENKGMMRAGIAQIIDVSVKQTLRRSVFTSLTTLFTIGAIYVFGVQSVKEFALPLIVGIISGTYSSVFLSGSFWYAMLPKREK